MYLSLYGVLWSLGIQYKYGDSSDSIYYVEIQLHTVSNFQI